MCNKFFRFRRIRYDKLENIELEIKELSVISVYFIKNELKTVWDMLFQISDYLISGETLYKKHRKILLEADSIVVSGSLVNNYSSYTKRVLLNYTVGFIKNEINKEANKK